MHKLFKNETAHYFFSIVKKEKNAANYNHQWKEKSWTKETTAQNENLAFFQKTTAATPLGVTNQTDTEKKK